MSIEGYIQSSRYKAEKEEMPVIQAVIERVAEERPFQRAKVAVAHFLALNSVTMLEAFWRGGAQLVLCNPFPSPRSVATADELIENGFPFYSVPEAVELGEYFIDNAGSLGKEGTPRAAVEVTRTGEYVYQSVACPTISIDQSQIKHLEDFLGTGDSFVRGWYNLRADDPLDDKNIVLFGYGKVGRGVAHCARRTGAHVSIADINPQACRRAQAEGFFAVGVGDEPALRDMVLAADIVIGATGLPGAVARSVPHNWLRANRRFLVNMGIDEFGEWFGDDEVLGGRTVPINWHLSQPTRNRYIDPVLAAQVLALEELIVNSESYPPGLHPLPQAIDDRILQEWLVHWPDEDLSGLAGEIELTKCPQG
jgi:adenosylhomocysteinase